MFDGIVIGDKVDAIIQTQPEIIIVVQKQLENIIVLQPLLAGEILDDLAFPVDDIGSVQVGPNGDPIFIHGDGGQYPLVHKRIRPGKPEWRDLVPGQDEESGVDRREKGTVSAKWKNIRYQEPGWQHRFMTSAIHLLPLVLSSASMPACR